MTQDPGTWHTTGMSKMPFLLPDLDALDPAALKAMICLQHAELISHKSQIEHLELLIAKLRRMQFGRSSEKVERQIEQLELKLEELEANRAEVTAEPTPESSATARRPASRKRRSLPDHLPREVHTHLPQEESCSACGGALKKLGEDISEMLEYLPASFKVTDRPRPDHHRSHQARRLRRRRRRRPQHPGHACTP